MTRFSTPKASFAGRDVLKLISDSHRSYCDDVEAIINDALEEQELPYQIAIDTSRLLDSTLRDEIAQKISSDNSARQVLIGLDGTLAFPEKGEVIANILRLLETVSHIALEAETQYGKTIISIVGLCLRTLINEKTGNREMIALVNPMKNSGNDQTEVDLDNFIKIHGGMHLIGETFNLAAAAELGYINSFKRSRDYQVTEIIQTARERDFDSITLVIDEADEASGIDSVISRWRTGLEGAGFKVRLLLVSATSYPYSEIGFEHYRVPIANDSGYSGTVAGKRTPVIGMTKLAKHLGIPALSGFTLADYTKNVNSTAPKKKRIARLQAEMLAEAMVKACLDAPVGNGFNGLHFNGGKYGMVRIGNNKVTDDFIKHASPILRKAGINVLGYFGPSMKRKGKSVSIKTMLQEQPGYSLIVMKGAGRRQDRFPADCTMAFDFTDAFSTTTAMEQGTMGRLSGWNKITETRSTLAILSDENEEMIRLFREDYDFCGKKTPRTNPGSHSKIIEKNLPKDTVQSYVEIDFTTPAYSHLVDLRRELTEMMAGYAKLGEARGTVRGRASCKVKNNTDTARPFGVNGAFSFDRLLQPHYDAIHRAMFNAKINAKLLRPLENMVSQSGKKYAVVDGEFAVMDVRNSASETGGVQKGGKSARHSKPMGKSKAVRAGEGERVIVSFNFEGETPVVDVLNVQTAYDYVEFDQSYLPQDERLLVRTGPTTRSMFDRDAA